MNIDEKFESALKKYSEGSLSEAEEIFTEIVHIQPENTGALYFLAELCYRRGEYDSAFQHLQSALLYEPGNAETYNNLGLILQGKKKFDDSIEHCRKAIQLDPDLTEAYLNLGNAYKEKGLFEDAIESYQKVIKLNPNIQDAHVNLGIVFQKTGRFDEAILHCRKALKLNPDDSDMYFNLGTALQEKGHLKEAIECYQEASRLNPDDAEIYNNLAFALQENRQPCEALPYYRKALQLAPGYATAHWNMSLALLLTGNFREGWREYEWRWETKYLISSRRTFPQRLWDGSDIKGLTILLHAEQGFGDTIQFIRYAPLVARRGAKIIFECPKELISLLRSVEGIEEVIVRGETLPEFNLHCPLLSLPLAFDTTLETIPAMIPYITNDPTYTEKWKNKIDWADSRFRIGLAWAGNPGFKQNRYRNCELENFLPLTQLPRVIFYSLQKGEEAKEAKHPPGGMKIIDLTEDIHDFSDTAAFIENIDLVISIDTAVTHLAGAMGRPVWTLLPFSPEWRWMLNREDSPWYPTMRLFRQSSHGDWESVISLVEKNLSELLENMTSNNKRDI